MKNLKTLTHFDKILPDDIKPRRHGGVGGDAASRYQKMFGVGKVLRLQVGNRQQVCFVTPNAIYNYFY